MVTIHNNQQKSLKGVIYYKDEVIGMCDNADTFLDLLCQIKKEQSSDYKMEVEVEMQAGVKRTYVYKFSKNGTLIPSSYPGVHLWTDTLNQKLLYLYNFSINYEFKLA